MLHTAVLFGGDLRLPVSPVSSLPFGFGFCTAFLPRQFPAPLSWRMLSCRAEDLSLWLVLFLALLAPQLCASSAADGSNVPTVV